MNLVCCICTESLNPSADVFSTPCGHLFHNRCLHQWLDRSKSCPQCRFAFAVRNVHKVYFNIGNGADATLTDFGVLQQTNDDLKLQISQKTKQIKELEDKVKLDASTRLKLNDKYHVAQEKIRSSQFLVDTLREQLRLLESQIQRFTGIQDDLIKANAKLETLKLVQNVLDSTTKQAEEIVSRETNAKTLAVLVATLKRELVSSESRRKELSCYLENVQDECKKKDDMVRILKKQTELLKNGNERLKSELDHCNTKSKQTDNYIPKVSPPAKLENRKRFTIIRSTVENSPPVHEKVRLIEESTSPYLHIKSSSVGLAPLLLKAPPRVSDVSGKQGIQIFKKPRLLADSSSIPRLSGNGNSVLNGLGCSDRRNMNGDTDAMSKLKK